MKVDFHFHRKWQTTTKTITPAIVPSKIDSYVTDFLALNDVETRMGSSAEHRLISLADGWCPLTPFYSASA